MNTHTNKKVVCVKDIPSNLIEEAIFILKSDTMDSKNQKTNDRQKEIILKETEDFVNEYSSEFSKLRVEESKSKDLKNEIKLKVILGGILVVLICYLISLIF